LTDDRDALLASFREFGLPGDLAVATGAGILKNRVQTIGRDPARYSGHSLRAGFVTEAARRGLPMWRIKAQTGHLSDSTLERYIRKGELSSVDAAKLISASIV
jgi:integrase